MKIKLALISLLLSNYLYSQNVGINTDWPTARFHVNGTLRFEALPPTGTLTHALVIDQSGYVSYRDLSGFLNGGGGAGSWLLNGNSATTGSNFLGTIDNLSLRLRTNNTERMIITNTGNVGIGTSNPAVKLHVLSGAPGTLPFIYENAVFEKDGDVRFGAFTTGMASGGAATVELGHSLWTVGGRYPGFELQYSRQNAAGNPGYLRFNYTLRDGAGVVNTGSRTNLMVLDTAGRVGINIGGTPTIPNLPQANLHVNGTIRFDNLPTGGGAYLVMGANNQVMVSSNTIFNKMESTIKDLQSELVNLKAEMKEIKEKILLKTAVSR